VWTALGAVYVIWGSTYLAIRVMVETVPPLLGAGVRFVLAGALLLAVLAARGGGLSRIRVDRALMLKVAAIGTLLAAGGNGLVTVGEKHVPSGLASLIVASVPLWIVVYRTAFRDRVAGATLAGVAFGFAGVALLLLPGNRPHGVPLGATLIIVVAAASWGLGSFWSQRTRMPSDPLVSTGWQMLAGGVALTIASLASGEAADAHLGSFSAKSLLCLLYLILIGSIVAYSAYTWLLQHAPISQVATYAYVNPMVAVALGAVFLGEAVPTTMLAASALILIAVAAIVRNEARPRRAAPEPVVEPAA
jgi:drug/metabolite transporter (DMT)-like permease